jgi:type IV pilus assembly protein PilW
MTMIARPSSSLRRQRGLTLTELMISVVIGLLVVSALIVVYLGSRAAYRSSESLARVQETGRFAVDFIVQDSRMSSYMGCRSRNLLIDDETLINITANPVANFSGAADGAIGFENGTGWTNPTAITRVAGDVLTLRRGTGLNVGILSNSNPVARTVTLRHNAIGLSNNDLAVLTNCERALVFRVTNSPALTGIGDYPTVLEYKATGAGANGTAGNDTREVPTFNLGSRAEVLRFVEISYFIGQNAAGRPGLYRAAGGAVEELVENVEDMDIVYGVDTTLPDRDGIVDAHLRADQITAANWSRVVSARISLLVVGPEERLTTARQTYAFGESGGIAGTDGDGLPNTFQAPADGRLRHVFTTTISLRNRVL